MNTEKPCTEENFENEIMRAKWAKKRMRKLKRKRRHMKARSK
ncbi:hypothetical protein QR46_2499 [Giardia duodenalis assemblage B]|uniref:60S ribosomal protein L41 n=2 Tax=Giardia intestinalis TaxID=5741 RepID=A0A132NTS5_GIAIN|nr:Hypothetical protein GSB_151147 [Giardia intestinalis]KWX13483.1 hypothetical protein QR46_2499 [Giardia intestinalis assemblage B]7PWF_n Chain n, Ribosomal protein eL41 [Giardia lamblia ATCC 50803]7PWO_n1 Chain n1, Ribosomal protein eL41 [Giardia lamblia ATCC 50803]